MRDAIMISMGIIIGWLSLMALRVILYRANKMALDAELRRLEDEEILKQYKDGEQ
jgi:hypothetical protein